MTRLILVLEVEPIPEGIFREWPLHCTLEHWFDYEGDLNHLINKIEQFFSKRKPILLTGADEALFGNRHDVPVNRLQETDDLKQLHKEVAELLKRMGAKFTVQKYMLEGYKPRP